MIAHRTIHVATFLGLLLCWSPANADEELTAEQKEFFESKIRPIFVEHCYECHSVKAEDLEGGLLLDSKWGWETGGDTGPAIKPGKPDESLVIHAVRYEEDVVSAMPPRSKLKDDQIKLLEKWVSMGAPDPRPKAQRDTDSMVAPFDLKKRFEEHWSWRTARQPELPPVENQAWPRKDFDRFILSAIESAGLQPAIEADRATWLRRVHFDLTGLPPTPQQLDAFLGDDSENAYEKVVQTLLESPHFGEKWARHWMDLVRYAETYGHEFDYPINQAYEYRDYLIRAFNADVPYDQFIKEHIAGDLLPQPRLHPNDAFNESIIATGFWYLHEATHAPTDVLGNEADIIDNQVDVFGKAFLGLTIACARCHDHKFDAISTADYYALSAYIQSSCRQRYPLDPGRRIEKTTERIKTLRRDVIATMTEGVPDDVVSPQKYLAAATKLIRHAIDAPDGAEQDIVWEGFENGYENWSVEGEAFGSAPAAEPIPPQTPFVNSVGNGVATSFGGNDKLKGRLTSKPFKIERPYIHLRVGGGNRGVGIELRIGDRVIHKANGQNKEDLIAHVWDVREHVGKDAVIRIFDEHEGGWGHVNVDQIVFSRQPDSQGRLPRPQPESIAEAAKAQHLVESRLRRWIDLLTSVDLRQRADSVEAILASRIQNPDAPNDARRRRETELKQAAEFANDSTLLADFSTGTLPSGWSTSGTAFQPVGDDLHIPIDGWQPKRGTVDSTVLGRKQSGILRSPTFEITGTQIHVLMRATANVEVNVVMDNYQMAPFNALLFRGTFLHGGSSDTKDQWQWKTLGGDLRKYVGHKAYLEFVDRDDAAVAVDEIRMTNRGPSRVSVDSLTAKIADSPEALESEWNQARVDVIDGKRNDLLDWLINHDLVSPADWNAKLAQSFKELASESNSLPQPRYVIAMAEGTKEDAHVYVRGSHTSLGEVVPPRYLEALGGQTGNRLQLAERIASGDNPLTSRVIVNRVWHHLFGRGIVPSVDDFGPQGEDATHPEMLDWLAVDFVNQGWSLKNLIGDIVLSQTYRQSSLSNPAVSREKIADIDPTNSLLYRMRVRRLPAESIRDGILAVSGRLDPKLYGGSVATHRNEFMTGRGARSSGPLDGNGRRSIYLSIYRNFLSPFLLAFDMPSPFGPKGRRSVSNVPAQALTLMNDPFVIQQADVWATRVLAAPDLDDAGRIALMIRQAHGTEPTERQLKAYSGFLDRQAKHHGARDKRIWADLGHALFNMKSFYFVK